MPDAIYLPRSVVEELIEYMLCAAVQARNENGERVAGPYAVQHTFPDDHSSKVKTTFDMPLLEQAALT